MQPSLQSIMNLETELDQLRASADYQPALNTLDEHLKLVFNDDGADETIERLAMVAMLAAQKASLLQEISHLQLVNGNQDGEAQPLPALDPQRRQEFTEQSLNWFQVAMAAGQRALSLNQYHHEIAWNRLLRRQLSTIRRGFLQASQGNSQDELLRHLPIIRHLFSLLWLQGELAGAEDLLYLLAELEGRPAVMVTARTFYQELQKLSDSQLEQGGLPREEIRQALQDWFTD